MSIRLWAALAPLREHEPMSGASEDNATSSDDRLTRLLRSMELGDVELHDPPPDLWGRIAAAVSRASATRDEPQPADEDVIEYRIDADDRVTPIGRGWSHFASTNGADALDHLTEGRTLWSFFDSEDIREIWRLVISRVRSTGSPALVPIRCDAPDLRRWFDLTVTPLDDGAVAFRCELRDQERRLTVELLQTERTPAPVPAVPICSWCAMGYDGERWITIEDLVATTGLLEAESLPPVSYGICGGCRDAMAAELVVHSA